MDGQMSERLVPSLAPLYVLAAFFSGVAVAFALHGFGFEPAAVTVLALSSWLIPISFVWMVVEGLRPQ
jgi:hypothetical protein